MPCSASEEGVRRVLLCIGSRSVLPLAFCLRPPFLASAVVASASVSVLSPAPADSSRWTNPGPRAGKWPDGALHRLLWRRAASCCCGLLLLSCCCGLLRLSCCFAVGAALLILLEAFFSFSRAPVNRAHQATPEGPS
eukprot:2657240-Amphidinium_carterae.1